jgi:hypothetical protein
MPRLVEQRLDAFDGVNLARELREDGGLVAAARADLQHLVVRLGVEPLGHERDHVRLADRLPMSDRRGAVGERFGGAIGGEELLARHGPQRVEHALVADTAVNHLPADHFFQRRRLFHIIHHAPL